jgi:hypothetical protein
VDGVTFGFGAGAVKVLEPGAYAVIVADVAAFVSLYGQGIPIAGAYEGTLSDRGERIAIADASGSTVIDFTFRSSWYPETNGGGRSLVLIDPRSLSDTWGEATSWRASSEQNGSPGRADGGSGSGTRFVRGDANADGQVDIADAIFSLGFQFLGNQSPTCLASLDADGDGALAITDAIYLLGYLFLGSGSPAAPFLDCGTDPADPSCDSFQPCA